MVYQVCRESKVSQGRKAHLVFQVEMVTVEEMALLVQGEAMGNQVQEEKKVKQVQREIQEEMVILEEMVIGDKMVDRVTLVEMDKMEDLEIGVLMVNLECQV